jgi:peptidyl-prolyl cis-trans isomerase SurA
MRLILAIPALCASLESATVLDRVAVIVDRHVVKASDIERDLRVTAFLNQQPLNLSPNGRRQAADRLVDQEIIREEIVNGGYRSPPDRDADALESQIRRERFGGSEARWKQALSQYGLTEEQLRAQLQWQLAVLRFIDQRFRAGVLVSDDEVRSYYNDHLAELRRENPQNSSFEALDPKIRSLLEGQRINEEFTQWLEQARKRSRVEFKQEAFE